jgi:hypothetical protein
MRLIHVGMSLCLGTAAMAADTVTLRDGRVVTGIYLGGTAREVKIEAGDQIQTWDVANVSRIDFGGAQEWRGRETSSAVGSILLPAGTKLVIRMIDGVDSERNSVGQRFAASLDEPVVIDGQTVIPRGADVIVKLVEAKESGKFEGRTSLTLDLMSVMVNGRMVDVNTETVTEESSSRGKRTAKVVGGTAALGTIAGGGKGAAIGLGAGAAAGAGAEILTKGQRVKIPSESRLTFMLDSAVHL